jgi:uncharacterized protein (DUF924 family)
MIRSLSKMASSTTTTAAVVTSSARLSEDVLSFWFREAHEELVQHPQKDLSLDKSLFGLWFQGGLDTDQKITQKFKDSIRQVYDGEHDKNLGHSPTGVLSMIIVLDQFTRNVYRNTPEMFGFDDKGLEWAKIALERRYDKELHLVHRMFLYLPFEHSENLADQEICVAKNKEMMDEAQKNNSVLMMPLLKVSHKYAIDHRDIIARFNRFPHRNNILGRTSTDEEIAFLNDGAETYGVANDNNK